MTLEEWPVQHVVKCLLRCHPDDDEAVRRQQERQLARLFNACRATSHELLLEIIPTHGAANDAARGCAIIGWIYGLASRPIGGSCGPPDDRRLGDGERSGRRQ